ncbi:ubiquitin carboxyl-terminal hydrolase 8-like [Ornithodoros turicata]|uniref:ubiquitin carboxyl-terminal hydrolase 8-like n=1 Tax=Ornithodoros turicata TaxID=34597 RepID=UPI00313A3384
MLSKLQRRITFAPVQMDDGEPPGMVNRGRNLCFAISSLQCIFRTPEMGYLMEDWLTNSTLLMSNSEEDFLLSFLNLMRECLNRNLRPTTQETFIRLCRTFMPQLVAAPSSPQEQQDAAEFTMTLLNILHKILNSRRKKNKSNPECGASSERNSEHLTVSIAHLTRRLLDYILQVAYKGWEVYESYNDSPIVHLFTGQTADVHQCTTCLKTSIRTQIFNILPISILQVQRAGSNVPIRLFDLLASFSEAGRMDSRNSRSELELQAGPICNMPEHTSWLNRTILSQTPTSVVLQLLRFQFDSSTGEAHKIKHSVHVPCNMCLPNGSGTWPQYQLYAVVVHVGARSTQDGHYIAYAEERLRGKWFKFDDEVVSVVPDMEGELRTPFLMENAYLLFYRKT